MIGFLFWVVYWTGVLVWAIAVMLMIKGLQIGVAHAVSAHRMATRITLESPTETPHRVWWWRMFWSGPITQLTDKDGRTIYWPGREPAGWYSE